MPNKILQEIDIRIERLKKVENHKHTTDSEKKCIISRILELESMKNYIAEMIGQRDTSQMVKSDFWHLVDEF